MRTFDNEWIFQVFEDHPSFFTKRMFGGLAVYLFGRQMMLLVEPTKTGRWKWHGVLICTEHAHQPAIIEEFAQLAPHAILKNRPKPRRNGVYRDSASALRISLVSMAAMRSAGS